MAEWDEHFIRVEGSLAEFEQKCNEFTKDKKVVDIMRTATYDVVSMQYIYQARIRYEED